MQRNETPHTADTGLSTEDLVRPRETDAAPDSTSPPPVSPGESDEKTDLNDVAANDTDTPVTEPRTGDADEMPQLLTTQDEEDLRKRWEKIQTAFVDDPRNAVQAADSLVANVMQTLATTFDEHKKELEVQWNQGGHADTEALRTALRHYRSFFNRLLTT
ncbi:hypothetical protein EDD90_2967 [Streptomyces sp. Ag109_O5-1]|uniref:hypothetical protein n=1 Tax=Streptomyces sp. Ag109_O5-1 TaxID=1938851 RepID=UPI000F5139A2|nr:hypothetical protein [Streptomyces sp. Ag109_O5-1]RPE39941.1 hypothetical protein EDD90_2967 [Streptomyces sp. Ag109_O5-1]